MSLNFASLNSGSNGNCYYVGNDREAVLIDAGIACRTIEKRLKALQLDIQKIKAVFISHEHGDHIKGLAVFSSKHRIPVYITAATLKYSRLKFPENSVQSFMADEPVQIGQLTIHPFSKYHDADDPHSFTISNGAAVVGVFTDIGKSCLNVIHHFAKCHAAFLEANYDHDMLMNGPYPHHLKARISGGNGHLGNHLALQLFQQHRAPFLTHLILCHLSEKNNTPEKVDSLFKSSAAAVQVFVASRYEASPVFQIRDEVAPPKPKQWIQGKFDFA